MNNIKLFFIISVLSLLFLSFNDNRDNNKKEKNIYKKAQREYYNGNYKVAKNLYLQLLAIDSCNFDYNYELALLFFYELNKKNEAIYYFETASHYMTKDTIPDLYNYLGQAYYAAHRYDDAIVSYKKYSKYPPKEGFFKISMKNYIKRCNTAKEKINEYEKNKKEYGIINLGPNINTEFPEYTAFEIFSDSVLIFNSLRDFDIDFNEYIKIPSDLIAIGRTRSSLLRMGAHVPSSVWDSGFEGYSKGMLIVNNNYGMNIQRNARVLQLIFMEKKEDNFLYNGIYNTKKRTDKIERRQK